MIKFTIISLALTLMWGNNSPEKTPKYDSKYVDISTLEFKDHSYDVVSMSRKDNRIKAKYFGAKDYDNTSVPNRYKQWAIGKNIICLTSAGYMDDKYIPVGLTIDNGVLVNGTIADFDGLVIVYATGGVVASDLKKADLTVTGGDIPAGTKLDLKNNAFHLQQFIDWAESQKATVFQTHLFVYKNILDQKTEKTVYRERRFLAVGSVLNKTTNEKEVKHIIVNSPSYSTLYDGCKRSLDFLNTYKNMEVTFMINLDPGAQNVFFLYDSEGKECEIIKGTLPISSAANLLVYYYE